MKTLALILVVALGAGVAGFTPCRLIALCTGGPCSAESAPDAHGTSADEAPNADAPSGDYLEARSATVFGGACHYNAEVLGQGRDAVLGWRLESGSYDGQSLAGVTLAAAVGSAGNLAQGGERKAVVYVDEAASEAQRSAAVAWLGEQHGDALGRIAKVRAVPVRLEREGDSFRLSAGDELLLEGDALADRSCCTMPENRWYEPLASGLSGEAVVGKSAACRFAGAEGLPAWTYAAANNVFVARLEGAPAAWSSAAWTSCSEGSAVGSDESSPRSTSGGCAAASRAALATE